MGLFINLGSLLSGGKGSYHGSNKSKGFQEVLSAATNEETYLGDLLRKYTGSGLTTAEQQANAFTAQREDIAWQRQLEASNTSYQRQVADMKAAGLNPMLAVSGSGGAAVPSASSSGSVSPSGSALNLGSLISALTGIKSANADAALKQAQTEKAEAETAKTEAETATEKQQFDYFERVKNLREEGERLTNEMSHKRFNEIDQNIEESKARTGKALAETHESAEKAALYVQQAIESKANVENMQYLQPFIAGELSARSSHERQQAKLAAVDAAYRQGLIDNGAIEAAIRKDNASASDLEITAKTKEFAQSINDGSLQKAADAVGDWRTGLVAGLYTALNNAVKSALGKW